MMSWTMRIQMAVAWADIILCEISKALLFVLSAGVIGGLVALITEGKRRFRSKALRRRDRW